VVKKKYVWGRKKEDRGAGAGKGPSARRGQMTQRPAFSHSFVGVCTPLVCTAGLSFCPCCSASAELTTPTASGASCVLGLQRAWAQPRRTDSSTCSATSSQWAQEAAEKQMKKNNQCTYVLYLARIKLFYTYDDVIFFIAFLSSPYLETPKKVRGEKIDARPRKTFLSRF
jgi:hypothetical protein